MAGFVATASARLDPVLAPRGFPYDGRHNGVTGPGVEAVRNQGAVLFHCDGKDELAEVMGRYHGWSQRLSGSYGPQPVPCLDLWVLEDDDGRRWDFEIFEDDVARAAGRSAMERLEQLDSAHHSRWIEQLATILDTFLTALETGRLRP